MVLACVSSGLPSYAVASGTASRWCRVSLGAVVTRQSMEAFGSISSFWLQLRCSHLEICALFPPDIVLYCPVSGVWVLLLEYRELVFLGDAVGRNAWLVCGDMLCLSVA